MKVIDVMSVRGSVLCVIPDHGRRELVLGYRIATRVAAQTGWTCDVYGRGDAECVIVRVEDLVAPERQLEVLGEAARWAAQSYAPEHPTGLSTHEVRVESAWSSAAEVRVE